MNIRQSLRNEGIVKHDVSPLRRFTGIDLLRALAFDSVLSFWSSINRAEGLACPEFVRDLPERSIMNS